MSYFVPDSELNEEQKKDSWKNKWKNYSVDFRGEKHRIYVRTTAS